jgi:HSP20 family protein
MATIAVQKVKETEGAPVPPLLDEMRRMLSDVERKAFELFQHRGAALGHALDDWLQAERETLAAPPAELIETSSGFTLRMAIPGFSAKQVQVTATPQELIVKAEHASREAGDDERLCWSELPHNGRACRRVPLPTSIDIGKVTATLDDGMLLVRAAKSAAPQSREVAVAATGAQSEDRKKTAAAGAGRTIE